MYNFNSQKYIKYFYRIFKVKGISEPNTSLKFLLFKSKYFFNKVNTNKNKLITINHNRLKSFSHFNKTLKKQKIKFNEREKRIFIEDCFKRLNHFPIQYILKQWFFRNKIFYVDYNVLIPRIETEKIIDIAFEEMDLLINKHIIDKFSCLNETLELKFLEIGIGSGIISISILKEYQYYFKHYFEDQKKKSLSNISLKCIGIDINEKCCLVSNINSLLLKLPEKEFEIKNISFEELFEKDQFSNHKINQSPEDNPISSKVDIQASKEESDSSK